MVITWWIDYLRVDSEEYCVRFVESTNILSDIETNGNCRQLEAYLKICCCETILGSVRA